MDNQREDVRAIEAAAELLVRGLNRSDISSITDLVTDGSLLLPPARPLSKGQRVVEALRNFALANEGLQMLSTDMEPLGEGVVRDIGSLSVRRRESGERSMFRYILIWQKVGATWTISTLTWNREPQAGRRAGGAGQGSGQGEM